MAMKEDGSWTRRTYKIEEYLKKNAEPRTILVTERVFEIEQKIRKLQIRNGRIGNYLFHVNTPHAITGKLYRICRDLDIVRRSPHKCRKTYISNLLNSGIDPDFVREQAGHKDLQTTMKSYVYSTTRNDKKLAQLKSVMPI